MNERNKINDKKRIAIYARVSTEHEAQMSALENQVDWYQPILDLRPEWILIDSYIDKGITGTSAEKRPEFMRMIKDAQNNRFDMIITREVSRFARNTVDTLKYTRKLKEYGVEVFFLSDNIRTFDSDGEIRLTIMATLAQDESRKTSIRVKAGQKTSMEKGTFYGNGNILGYDRTVTYSSTGKADVMFIINQEQAEIVRMIFNMYLEGNGLEQIRKELEQRGIKTAMGKEKWHVTNISHILKNTFYCGIITYYKEYVPDYLTQKKIRNHGVIENLQVKGKHEPIITEEDFEKAQAIMESKRSKNISIKTGKRIGKNPRKIMWGRLLVCECGHEFSLRRWKPGEGPDGGAYMCYSIVTNGSYSSRKKKGLPTEGFCKMPMIPIWKLNVLAYYVFKYCSEELPNLLLKEDTNDSEDKRLLEQLKKQRENTNNKINTLIDMRMQNEISKETFHAKNKELEDSLKEIEKKIVKYDNNQFDTVFYENFKSLISRMNNVISSSDTIPDEEVEKHISKIKVYPDESNWYLNVLSKPKEQLVGSFTITRDTAMKFLSEHGEKISHKKWKDYTVNVYI